MVRHETPLYWAGPRPKECEGCGLPIFTEFFDIATTVNGRRGPWGCLCRSCAVLGPGCGYIGPGYGQKYERQDDGRFLKTEGTVFAKLVLTDSTDGAG